MKEEFKKYIKKEEYNPDINKTEIWIGNFSNDPIEPIDVICEIIRYFNYKNYNIIVDDYLSYNNRGIWDSPIIFNNITFNEEVAFMFYSFKDNISFINCTFKEDIIFGNCTFAKDISFRNCTFRANTNFWHTTFSSTSVFSESKFEGFDNNFCQSHFYGDIFCENIIVKSNINFSDSIFEENAYFKGAILGGEANFSEVKFKTNQKDINDLENINKKQKEEIDFSIVEFETVIFKNAFFFKNVRFHKSIFKNTANFTNTKFCNLVDFYYAHFYKPQQFHFTDFLDRAIFSNTEFDEEVQFLHCRVDSNSYIRFESATFKKSLDISRSNFNDKANFWNIELEEGDTFTSPKYQNDFDEKAKTESTKNTPTIYKKIRETYRIIKSNFYSQNNKIEGLKFYEKEMSAYLEENRNKKDNSENYSSKKKEVNDSLLLKKCLTNKFINRLFTLLLILLYLPFCMFIILLSPIYLTAILIHKTTNIDTKNTLYFIINFIFLGLYIFTKDLIWYILFAPQYIYNILYSIPNLKKNISYSIKENNYISLIILSICLVSTLVAVYGIPNQNNYILLWEGKILSFNNNILTFISYISLIIIALLFVIIFKKNEKILLWFNKNSNNFGTNWFIGLNFTTLVALITYVVISLLSSNVILQFDAEGVGNFLKGLVKIINVTEWSDITFLEQELTNWQYIFLFIGRIFIGYGYYQTIQAFRKFGKS